MQELRFVLIVVGALAIAALLFHGLWTSKKEGKAKFGDKPLNKLDADQAGDELEPNDDYAPAPHDDYEIIRKERKEPDFSADNLFDTKIESDPLIDADPLIDHEPDVRVAVDPVTETPSFSALEETEEELTVQVPLSEPEASVSEPLEARVDPDIESAAAPVSEPEMEVIVLNVHCAGDEPFIGTKLFESMQQNGLIYGEMDIFHRHVDLSGNGKVLFSVANMMHPGTLAHDDPAEFTTKGISFFMTLPGYGEADQNFNLMLRTAQQIADELGGNVLDDQRNLMTPDRLAAYRRQIVEFSAANA
jgi:cell division protein ZipA